MPRPEPKSTDRPLPVSNLAIGAIVLGILVFGTLGGLGAFYLFGDAEEAPDTQFQAEQYGEDEQQVRIYGLSGEPIDDPGTVAITVDDEWVENNTGHDWTSSEDGIDADSEVFLAWNDTETGVVLADERDHESFDRGLPPGTEIQVRWVSDGTESVAVLHHYEVQARDSAS